MKRILTIARAHGAGGLWTRALAYGGSALRRCARAVALLLTERKAMRLSRRGEELEFIPAGHPAISVVVVGARDWRYANRCLRALKRLQSEAMLEVFVSGDARVERQMQGHRGVQLLSARPDEPLVEVFKEAASRARGRYFYVIDSRALPATGAISWLAAALDRDDVACASSQIRSFSGALREAGRTISGDGKIVAVGAGASRSDSRFVFVRDIAIVSPASFMTKIDPLKEALSRTTAFRSASYAVADLSNELRACGLRCVYQPLSRVSCAQEEEGADDTSDSPAFAKKWLRDARSAAIAPTRSLLVVDEHVPFDDRDAGSRRLGALLRLARDDGWTVAFGSIDRRAYAPYFQNLAQDGIEPILGFTGQTLADLASRGSSYDCIWLCRPQIAEEFIAAARTLQPRARIVYDTIDLHHLRLSRQAEVRSSRIDWKAMERRELDSARRSDVVVVTSPAEVEVLRQADGVQNVAVVGIAEEVRQSVAPADERSGILFVGNYAHAPNVDAAIWLAAEIMPRVWQQIPDAGLTLAGADPTPEVRRLAGRRVRVPGFVADLEPLLAQHRIFAAPLRFGAGLKGKIIQAMAAGIPVVTTPVGAEGILRERYELATANDAQSFAAAILDLYCDAAKWAEYSNGGRRGALRFSPAVQAEQLRSVLGRAG